MENDLQIRAPLMHLTKAETVIEMNRLGRLDWYKDTHTCYEGLRPACSQCPACKLRLNGFSEAEYFRPIAVSIKNKRLAIQIYRYKRKKKANSEIFQCGFFRVCLISRL